MLPIIKYILYDAIRSLSDFVVLLRIIAASIKHRRLMLLFSVSFSHVADLYF